MHSVDTSELLALLRGLEVALHQPAARRDASRLDTLLHDDFREWGRSGLAYRKQDISTKLPGEAEPVVIVADRFEVRCLADGVALLTYRSAHRRADETLHAFTLRSSLWERTALGWQLRFHQATPTAPYEPE